jgi:sugar phosphate isomerase/epimerase
MHAKDMKIERHLLNDDGIFYMGWATPKVPGFGDVNWNLFVSTLTDIGYDGPICVEVEDRAFEHDLDARHKSLQISYNVLSPIVL